MVRTPSGQFDSLTLTPVVSRFQVAGWSPGIVGKPLVENIASFLIMRGPFAYMGFAWQGCTNTSGSPVRHNYTPCISVASPRGWRIFLTSHLGRQFRRPPEVDVDHGVPLGLAKEVEPGVFVREWSKATAKMDCNVFRGEVRMKTMPEVDR